MWKFFKAVGPLRQQALLESPEFGTLSTELILATDLEGFYWEEFESDRLRGCRRASFLLRVPEHLYDCFFNSPQGYRGQYAISPDTGANANRALINLLQGTLLTQSRQKFDVDEGLASKSVNGEGAKIWIYEPEVHDHLFEDEPEIDFPRWIRNSDGGVGPRAPQGSQLVMLGAWLDESNNVQIDTAKSSRSHEIHMTGFS